MYKTILTIAITDVLISQLLCYANYLIKYPANYVIKFIIII